MLAIDDADYPWLVLVPRRPGVTEIADLGADATLLMDEILQASAVLKDVTRCNKLNIAAIGNVVPQLHIHIVARWIKDPLWPKPVGGMRSRARGCRGLRAFCSHDAQPARHYRAEFIRSGEDRIAVRRGPGRPVGGVNATDGRLGGSYRRSGSAGAQRPIGRSPRR